MNSEKLLAYKCTCFLNKIIIQIIFTIMRRECVVWVTSVHKHILNKQIRVKHINT